MKSRIGRLLLVGSVAVAAMFVLPACDTKDDDLFARVEKLEDICKEMNANISSLQSVMDAVKNNYSIVSVTEMEGGKGYTLQLSNG